MGRSACLGAADRYDALDNEVSIRAIHRGRFERSFDGRQHTAAWRVDDEARPADSTCPAVACRRAIVYG
jgi:hypothetical protein